MNREDTKRLYLAYRERAQLLCKLAPHLPDLYLSTSPHANVQLCEDGAFVEAVIWIPKDDLK